MHKVLEDLYRDEVKTLEDKLVAAASTIKEAATDTGEIARKTGEIARKINPAKAAELLARARANGWQDIHIGGCVGPINGWMWKILSVDVETQSITIKPQFKQSIPSSNQRKRARARRIKSAKGKRHKRG